MDADELYALRPEEFTTARNALAKELKAAGDKEASARVAKLRKPSVGAWALNQVAREEPGLIGAALEAGAALRAASEGAASGDASGLRTATAAERAAAQAVAKAARVHLGARADALTPALLSTLRAAALDDEVAAQVRSGTLTNDHEQAGFGFGIEGDSIVVPRRAPKGKVTADREPTRRPKLEAVPDLPQPDPEARARERAERAEARAAERQRRKDQKAAEDKATRLEREAQRLAKEATVAEGEAAEARRKADDAVAKAKEARAAADDLAG